MLNHPIVALIEKAEDFSQLTVGLAEELVKDIELCPLNLVVIVKVICLQKLLLDLIAAEFAQVIGVGGLVDILNTALDHFKHYVMLPVPIFGVKNSDNSLRSALRPYSLNYFWSFFPS